MNTDLPDLIAGALGVSRGTAYDLMREALGEQTAQQDGPINEGWQITVAHGHSGYGVYAHMEDYPEEGAVLVQAIEQPAQQQEPVAWQYNGILHEFDPSDWATGPVTPLYTSPPAQRKPLTDEDIYKIANDLFYGNGPCDTLAMCRAIEAAHGITGEQK